MRVGEVRVKQIRVNQGLGVWDLGWFTVLKIWDLAVKYNTFEGIFLKFSWAKCFCNKKLNNIKMSLNMNFEKAKGQMIFKRTLGILEFSQKTNKRIRFYYLFVCFLGEFGDTNMSFRNYLTFTLRKFNQN